MNENLYQADSSGFIEIVTKLHKKISKVLLVGHNPGLEEFAQLLSGEAIAISTCSLIQFSLDIKYWKELESVKQSQVKVILNIFLNSTVSLTFR